MAPARREPLPEVRVVQDAAAGAELALAELRRFVESHAPGVVSFATGSTFEPMLRQLALELTSGRLPSFVATHLDEYLGFAADTPGGMLHELESRCPPLSAMRRRGALLPVPSVGDAPSLQAHTAALQRQGGIGLQFLGIGRNGHLAFVEPGTPFELGFHLAALAASTREDARARFHPDEPPTHGVTAGIATILAAARIVLCAYGAQKAGACRAMLAGEPGPQCPASAIRQHGNALVLLDAAAAAALPPWCIDPAGRGGRR